MKNWLTHPRARGCRLASVSMLVAFGLGVSQIHSRAQAAPLLVQPSDLKYQGAFRVPAIANAAFPNGFDFGGQMLAFDASRNALFIGGYGAGVGEISIPGQVVSASLASLNTASLVQAMVDPGEGIASRYSVTYGPTANSDLFVYGGQLLGAVSTYYDAGYLQQLSHFTRPLDLSVSGRVQGLYQIGNLGPGNGGRVSGWMASVPSEWQGPLGGPVLVGECCIPIITRTSWGPSAFSFDPATLGSSPAPLNSLIYYPTDHPWGTMEAADPVWNGSTTIGGMVLPNGTRTLLYFGRHGIGPYCYGTGGPGATDPTTEHCYDPENGSKGMHGYPYVYQVTAYDANDMAAVKSGSKQPWDLRPYAVWQLKFPIGGSQTMICGVAYDSVTGRIFATEGFADDARPLVHVFTIGGSGADISYHVGPIPSPSNVRIIR